MFKNRRTYLVTGGSGFIGSNFIHYMLGKYGYNIFIINLDKLTYAGNPDNNRDLLSRNNYVEMKVDICDETLYGIFERWDIDVVVHFAAESHVDRSINDPTLFVKTNVLGTANLLQCAKKAWELKESKNYYQIAKRFLHVSTDEVYGSLDNTEDYFTETTPYAPHSPYSASKAGSDLLVKSFIDTYNFPAIITNCSNNYGPYQYPEKLIPLVICNALEGKEIPVYGDGSNIRDWLYVIDHCRAIDMVLRKGTNGNTYNIGGHNERTNLQIVKTIISALQELLDSTDSRKAHISENLITYVSDRPGHDKRYAIDPTKISTEVGWKPDVTFEEGIKKTVKWYLDNPKWIERVKSKEYKTYYDNMYKERG